MRTCALIAVLMISLIPINGIETDASVKVIKAKAKTFHSEIQIQKPTWEPVTARITEYCPICNCPSGYESSSGQTLQEGDCACSWLPIGTEVKINGCVYTVVDICGTDAIDVFRDTDTCECDLNETITVYVKER